MATAQMAARQGQQLLRAQGNPKLKVDGVWGPLSTAAYETGIPDVRNSVDRAVEKLGYKVKDLAALTGVNPTQWATEAQVNAWIAVAVAKTGLSAGLLSDFVAIEASKRKQGSDILFNVRSVAPSGLFHGLMQMGAPAWSDVMRAYKDTPSFANGRYDGQENVLAGARYALLNQRTLRSLGYKGDFGIDVMYAAHNQGAGGFWSLVRNGRKTANFTNQSSKAQQVIVAAVKQAGGSLA